MGFGPKAGTRGQGQDISRTCPELVQLRFARACVFVHFRTVQYELNKISRFYAQTPKITYLGRFSSCVMRCRKVVHQLKECGTVS